MVGGPHTGKTTLARQLAALTGRRLISADDIRHLGWSESSQHLADMMADAGPWIIEGVQAARAMRKWLAASNDAPADLVIYRHETFGLLKPGHISMGKGVRTVMQEIHPALIRAGVELVQV